MQGLERWFSCYEHWLVLPEDSVSIPSTHMVAHKQWYFHFQKIWCPLLTSEGRQVVKRHAFRQNTTGKKNLIKQKYFLKKGSLYSTTEHTTDFKLLTKLQRHILRSTSFKRSKYSSWYQRRELANASHWWNNLKLYF